MKIVYIAGPFRADNSWEMEQNIRRAEALALEVWAAGMVAICPHLNTRYYQGVLPDDVWLCGDLEILKRCDAIIMTDDWLRSSGARAEHKAAQIWNLPIFYNMETLISWARGTQ